MAPLPFPPLYAILDPALAPRASSQLAEDLAASGVSLIQLRDKRSPASELLATAREWIERVSPYGARIIINDRADVAVLSGAGGVHVGQEDLPVEAARRICGGSCWVGVSTHNLIQLRQAADSSADYIALGPVFATSSKVNPDPVVGLDFIRQARSLTQKPLVAIGGITIESAAQIFRAGADSVAVIRDLVSAPDPACRAREYAEVAERVKAELRGSLR